jgi:arylsulfatase A-like enzyme
MKILVLELVGCHLGYLGCYGNEWVATPNLDALAAEGIVFDQHFAESPPIPFEPALSRKVDTIDELLDAVDDIDAGVVWIAGPRLTPPWDPDACITDYAEDDELTPWFEGATRVTPDDMPSVRATYAGVVTYLDAQLGNLFEALDDSWTIVVTASSGFALEELATGASGIGEESVHLPLIIRFADGRHAGERISALTQPSDLAATLRALLGLPATSGRDLMTLVRGEVESLRPSVIFVGGDFSAVRTQEWTLLRSADAPSRLYVKPDDRWEVNDVAPHHPEVVEKLEAELAQRKTGDAP